MEKILDYLKQNKIEILCVSLIVLCGLVLRLIALLNFGTIWYDELFSWYFASRKSVFDTIFCVVNEDIHMPLYFALLHFYIKLFGDNIDAMRLLSFVLSFPLVPLGFYVSKKLFNLKTAYFCAIFLALNTFCIYYSLEIRFYALVLVFSPLYLLGFIELIEQNKKFLYILSNALLLYTFTIAPLLVFLHFLFGFIYLLVFKKSLKEYLKANIILFLISSPVIFQVIQNALALNGALTYYPRDYFEFNPYIIYDILENFFSFYNLQLLENNYTLYHPIFEDMNLSYFFFVFIPLLIVLFALFKALSTKNKRLYLIFLPSITFLLIMLILAFSKQAVIQTRYLCVIFPCAVMCFCFGLAALKPKLSNILFIVFILLNSIGLITSPKNVITLHRDELSGLANYFQNEIKIKNDDVIFAPMLGERIKFYSKKGLYIPFTIEDAFVLKDKEALRFYLGDNYYNFNYNNIKDYLYPYILKDIPLKTYEKNLKENYIDEFKKGQRVVLISLIYTFIQDNSQMAQNYDEYKNMPNSAVLTLKPIRDSLLILQKYLRQIKYEITQDGVAIYIFEK